VIYENFGRFIRASNDDLEPLLEGMCCKIDKDIEAVIGEDNESKDAV